MTDDNMTGRDRNGRWKKGYCPNLKGRPRKKPPISEADVYVFKQTQVAVIGGTPTRMNGHAASCGHRVARRWSIQRLRPRHSGGSDIRQSKISRFWNGPG